MSTTEGLQQPTWPDLDVSYFRWEPPVFPAAPSSTTEAQLPPSGKSRRIESAFAHSPYPTSFVGWGKVRAESAADQKAAEALSGNRTEAGVPATLSHALSANASEPLSDPSGEANSIMGYPASHTAPFEASQARVPLGGQGSSSAFTSLRPGERQQAAHQLSAGARNFSWPAQQPDPPPGHSQSYGAAFESVFSGRQPADMRYGVPEGQRGSVQPSARAAAVGQNSLPLLLVQCGKFSAPVQREGQRAQPQQSHWQNHHAYGLPSGERDADSSSGWQASRSNIQLERAPSSADPLQLQEYYTAQSDLIGELIKGNGVRDPHVLAAMQGAVHGLEMDHDFLDVLGPAHLGRATSVLDVPRVHPTSSSARSAEPYMPQWQSESVPAELPNHVVNRLLMGGDAQQTSQRNNRGLLGTKRDWTGLPSMPSIPDDRQLPTADLQGVDLEILTSVRDSLSTPPSPDVHDLEELARTADVEVAHRAFLVPPHKKRGKGGRQPAADPRLDPSIDSRRAKRILANRLSAARSKMKQKNQMDGLAGMVNELEEHSQQLRDDAAELMEICEETEFENRRLVQQSKVLNEYGRRQMSHHSELMRRRTALATEEASRRTENDLGFNRGGQAGDARGSAEGPVSLNRLASKPSTDSLFRGLQGSLSPGESLLEFARET